MAVAEGRVGELQRDVRLPRLRHEPPAALGEHLLDRARPDEPGQEVVDHDPLVVPGKGDPRVVEDVGLGHPVLTQQVDDAVVRAQQGDVQGQREQMHVVAGVADQGDALLVARHVDTVRAEQELRRVGEVEQVRRADRAVGVEHLQVEHRGAGVAQRLRADAAADGRSVGGDVVGDELAEERPASGLGGVIVAARAQPVEGRGGVADPAVATRTHQQPGVGAGRVQVREHPPITRRPGGPVHRAYQAEAVVAGGHAAAVARGAGAVLHGLDRTEEAAEADFFALDVRRIEQQLVDRYGLLVRLTGLGQGQL